MRLRNRVIALAAIGIAAAAASLGAAAPANAARLEPCGLFQEGGNNYFTNCLDKAVQIEVSGPGVRPFQLCLDWYERQNLGSALIRLEVRVIKVHGGLYC